MASVSKGSVNAHTLRPRDHIEVPVEVCEIIGVTRVPGQLKSRKNYLIQFKVRPTSGPWANCEGVFIMESDDPVPLVKKFSNKEKNREWRANLYRKIKEKIFGPKVEEVVPVKMIGMSQGEYT